jgi:hypothetical protein
MGTYKFDFNFLFENQLNFRFIQHILNFTIM